MQGRHKFILTNVKSDSPYHGKPLLRIYDSEQPSAPEVRVEGHGAREVHTQIMIHAEGVEREQFITQLYEAGCAISEPLEGELEACQLAAQASRA